MRARSLSLSGGGLYFLGRLCVEFLGADENRCVDSFDVREIIFNLNAKRTSFELVVDTNGNRLT